MEFEYHKTRIDLSMPGSSTLLSNTNFTWSILCSILLITLEYHSWLLATFTRKECDDILCLAPPLVSPSFVLKYSPKMFFKCYDHFGLALPNPLTWQSFWHLIGLFKFASHLKMTVQLISNATSFTNRDWTTSRNIYILFQWLVTHWWVLILTWYTNTWPYATKDKFQSITVLLSIMLHINMINS